MQEINQTFSEFSRRTEILATKLGVRLIDLPSKIGISKAMLFAYRKGGYDISGKAWAKLAAAERAAGITPAEMPVPPRAQHPPARADTSPDIATQLASLVGALAAIEARLDAIEAALRSLQPRRRR